MPIPDHYPFVEVSVRSDVEAGTRLSWTLEPHFRDPRPHFFQLQAAPSSVPGEEDWANVGPALEDAVFLLDPLQRDFGATADHHWRILLSTPVTTYRSGAESLYEQLDRRDWRLVREMLRQARLRQRKYTGTPGSLLKRRRYGAPCTLCLDPHTGEATRPDCPVCYSTEFAGGYHRALTGLWADMGLETSRESQDVQTVGTVKPVAIQADFHGFPLINARDVWCEARSGQRWFVEKVGVTALLRSYPFKLQVELRLAPLTDIVYHVPLT